MFYSNSHKISIFHRLMTTFLAGLVFLTSILHPAYAQDALHLPPVGVMVEASRSFVPVLLKGMSVDVNQALHFDFIIDTGNKQIDQPDIKKEIESLSKYFLAAMTVPQDDLWVNLSPYEQDRIIPQALGKTALGRDMLAQDYILKQLTASMFHPQKDLGKRFWEKLYQKIYAQYGNLEIPIDTFNKVWILPETAVIYQENNAVYITESRLKVLLETDIEGIKSVEKSRLYRQGDALNHIDQHAQEIIKNVIREIILPEIEREVNQGENFAVIRQIYHALILAQWYKQTIKESLLKKVYLDQNKIKGIDLTDPNLKDQIYSQYIEAFKKGVFDFIQEEYDVLSDETIPRQYFSGGEQFVHIPLKQTTDPSELLQAPIGEQYQVSLRVDPFIDERKEKDVNVSLIGFASPAQPHVSVTTALYALSGAVKQHFKEQVGVSIFDMYADHDLSIEKMATRIRDEKPRMIGMSLVPGTLEVAVSFVKRLKEMIGKENMPLLVFGNAVANYIPETILRNYFPEAVIVQREGDLAIIELIEFLTDQRKKEDVHNLVYLENGKLKQTFFKEVDIDLVAMDVDEMSKFAKQGVLIQLESSRGCPWGACLFCASRDLLGSRKKDRKWRAKPIEKVLHEIEVILDQDVSFVSFIDEEFIGPGLDGIKRTQDLLKGIIALKETKKKDFRFHISSRADSFFNNEDDFEMAQERERMLDLFKQAGLAKVFLGVESGSQTQLNRYNKGLDIAETEGAIGLLRQQQIVFELGFIMFDPEITLKEINENVTFLAKNRLIKTVSWFLNYLRIQAGTPFVLKYANMPEVHLSKIPNPVDLQYQYEFVDPEVRRIYQLSQKMTKDSAKLYYRLKSVYRGGMDGMKKEEYQQCINKKDHMMDIYFSSFQELLKVMLVQMPDEEKEIDLKRVMMESLLKQMDVARDLVDQLQGNQESVTTKEVIVLAEEFITQVTKTIAEEIVATQTKDQQTLSLMTHMEHTSPDANEIIFVLKPGGTFNVDVIHELIKRINTHRYLISGIKILLGEEIKRLDIFEKEHAFAFKVAREGKAMFSDEDIKRLKNIYDREEFETYYGVPFKDVKAIPAYDLIEQYGLSEEDVSNLWIQQYDVDTFMKGDMRGINKVGTRKYVVVARHKKVDEGKPFIFINGVCIQMKHIAESKGEPSVVFLLKRKEVETSKTWKFMRENFLGDKSPTLSPTGSIRHDAYQGQLGIRQEVPFWKNVAHLSSGPLEALLEINLWFSLPIKDSSLGQALLNVGYTLEEIEYFLTDPEILLSGKTKPLFDWTEKMDVVQTKEFLLKVLPPFYHRQAMPTITFKEFLRFMDAHQKGDWGVFSNIVDEKDIKPVSFVVEQYPLVTTSRYEQLEQRGFDLIRQGRVGQVLMAGGTAGRWFGYHVPEEKRIRFLADAYEFDGEMRSFAELKLAHNAWISEQAGGEIPVWMMMSELSQKAIREFMVENNYFGLSAKDVSFYVQGSIPRLNPNERDLMTDYPGKSQDWIRERIAENGSDKGIFRLKDDTISQKPMGHFDVIASLVLSRELLAMHEKGVEIIHFTDATNLGTNIDPVLLGLFETTSEDVLHVLAEKNRIFTIKMGDRKYHVAVRNGKVVESTLPKELEPVLEQGEVVGVVDQKTQQRQASLVTSALEKGGTLVDLKGQPQILEGFRFPKNYDQEKIPYFSTAHQLVRVEALLELFGLTIEEYRQMDDRELLERVSQAGKQIETYLETKSVLDEQTGQIRIATQLSRLSGDITSVLPTKYILIDRDGVKSQCAFLPFKNREDLEMNESSVRRVLKDKVLFLKKKSQSNNNDVLPGGIDMNNIPLNHQKENIEINIDREGTLQYALTQGVDGFIPVVVDIRPIKDLKSFFLQIK